MTLTVKEIENLLKQESLEDDFLRMIKSDNRVSVKKALEKWEKNKSYSFCTPSSLGILHKKRFC